MDFFTATALSGALYDLMKTGVGVTASAIKEKLQNWVVDDACAKRLALEVEKLNINDEMSEKAIGRTLLAAPEVVELIAQINAAGVKVSIIQTHSGTGDNIGNNQYVYKS